MTQAVASYVEQNCTIEHEGQQFSYGGAVVTDQFIVVYPRSDGKVTDWHGNVLGEAFVLSSWRIPNSYIASRMYSYAVYVNGVRYVGRGTGTGMILRARRSKRQS